VRRNLIVRRGASIAAVVAVAAVLYIAFRDRSVVFAVPRAELPVYARVFAGVKGEGAPRVRLQAFDGDGQTILSGRRPGLAVVSMASWLSKGLAAGVLVPLPPAGFPNPEAVSARLPGAFLKAVGSTAGGRTLNALPLAFDPWLAFWHRDFIGGAAATPPADWPAVRASAARWKQKGVAALALAGREPDALTAWFAILCGASGPGAAADAFGRYPGFGRETAASALELLADLERDGIVQGSAFSFPWQDAVDQLLRKQAAGMFLPLVRYRALNPAATAPLIIARVPQFPGTTGTAIVAEVRMLVMPARGARGRGSEKVVAYLARPEVQRSLADALGMVPARLDAPVRDGASFEGREAARAAAALVPMPTAGGDAPSTAALVQAAAAALRSPAEVGAAVNALYGAR